MIENLLVVTGQVVTLFLMMAVGFALVQFGKLTEVGLGQMSSLLLYVVSPCVVVEAFQQEGLPDPSVLALGLGVLALYYILLLPLTLLLYRRQAPKTRSSLRFGTVYGNVGFMGLPLLEVILGPDAMIYGAMSIALMNIFQWTHGVVAMGGKFSVKKAVVNPGVLSLLAAAGLYLLGIRLPGTVNTSIAFLADLNTPLAMVVIGGQMASANLVATFTQPKLYASAALKLLAAPVITGLVLLPLGLSPLLYCACVVIAATPTAGATSIFAQRFERDTSTAAQLVALSTLLSILTLPVFAVASQAVAARF